MGSFSPPRILVSGVSSQIGKSLFCLGLATELRRRKKSVSMLVKGPQLSEAVIFRRITGRYCRSLDANLLSTEQLRFAIDHAGVGADLVLIDGTDAIYDGSLGTKPLVSDSVFAKVTGTPVLLLVDGSIVQESIASVVRGFWGDAEDFTIAGVIANRLDPHKDESCAHHIKRLNRALEHHQLPKLLGGMPTLESTFDFPSGYPNQLGSSAVLPRNAILEAADRVAEYVDVNYLLECASKAQPMPVDSQRNRLNRRTRIAVTDDSCFSMVIQDNLEMLRYYGAEIVPFSPLADEELPPRIGGLYVTGAFLSEYMDELSRNESLYRSIRAFADAGGVIFSEGSGTAYLAEKVILSTMGVHDGVGLLPGFAEALNPPGTFCYAEIKMILDTVAGIEGGELLGLSTNEWKLVANPGLEHALRLKENGSLREEGFVPEPQMLLTFSFLHLGTSRVCAKSLVDSAQVFEGL